MRDFFKRYIYHIIFSFLMLTIFFFSFKKRFDLRKNHIETVGVITNYHFNNNNYMLYYNFTVNKRTYIGDVVVSEFYCDSTLFCIGSSFKVFYNPKDPTNNIMDLGEYRRYQENPPNWGNDSN